MDVDSEIKKTIVGDNLHQKMNGKPDFVSKTSIPKKINGEKVRHTEVQLIANATLPTKYGNFTLFGFYDNKNNKEHTALVKGDVEYKEDCPVRVHSQCHTGDVWGSLRCDCRDQLEWAMEYISRQPFGAIIYMKQEGRGIGLLNKIKAYRLQELGLDTVEANQYLGFPGEARSYKAAAEILRLLKVKSIGLLTNNPNKIDQLSKEEVTIARRIPIVMPSNKYNHNYLVTKKVKMGHLI